MTSSVFSRYPFSFKQGYSVRIASGSTSTQLVRMPWQTPVQKPGVITKIVINNPVGTAGVLNIWDQDLSNTTPPTAGSAGAALLPLEFGASAASGTATKTTVYTVDQLPNIQFIGGIVCQSTHPGVTAALEVEFI